MARVPLTPEELRQHLDEQLAFLAASCQSFDRGFSGESKRLAVVLRLLLHDTKHSKSLLSQLDLKRRSFLDSASPYNPRNLLPTAGMVGYEMSAHGTQCIPLLDDTPGKEWVPFAVWWTRIVFMTRSGPFARKDLVLTAADQDGGAHVDPALDAAYRALSTGEALAIQLGGGHTGDRSLADVQLVAIRQIAHEVRKTLIPGFSDAGPTLAERVAAAGIPDVVGPPKAARLEIGGLNNRGPALAKPMSGVDRNHPCSCGSGRKYKKCHGRL